jgi:replicative DNA helicase
MAVGRMDGMEPRRSLQDLAAERAVLGAILTDNTVVAAVAEVVHPDDFASPGHVHIFSAMLGLDATQRPVDHLTLSEELKRRGQLQTVGGPAYLMSLDQVVPVPSSAVSYANIVKDQAVRRRLAEAGREIQELASQDSGELDAILDEAERRVSSPSASGRGT